MEKTPFSFFPNKRKEEHNLQIFSKIFMGIESKGAQYTKTTSNIDFMRTKRPTPLEPNIQKFINLSYQLGLVIILVTIWLRKKTHIFKAMIQGH